MLQKVIESLADNKTPLEDGLRQLLVISYRADSAPLKEWVQGELDGYDAKDIMPNYRRDLRTHLQLKFVGWGPTYKTVYFKDLDIPKDLRVGSKEGPTLCQSVTELEELAKGEEDPGSKMLNSWVARYQTLAEQGKATSYTGMTLDEAHTIFPRTVILAILGNIRNQSLKMALELEAVSPDVGSSSGITEEQTQAVQQVVNVFIGEMTGDVNTVRDGVITGASSDATINKSLQYNENAASAMNLQGDEGTVK